MDAAAIRRALPPDATVDEWRAPDGWALRRFDWPGTPGRGRILFQGGRGDVFEKYLEAFDYWHSAGWSVTSFDWRGQGGSGRVSGDRHVGDIDNFASYIRDLRAFWGDWQAGSSETVVAIGHSMGGFLLLQGLVAEAITPEALVLVAPMLGLRSPIGAVAGEQVARMMAESGNPSRRAWRGNERPGAISRQALLTHDDDRYSDEIRWQQQKPELLLGPPSWRWMRQAFGWTRRLRADPRLREVRTPVLMLIAEADRLVDPRAASRVAGRLPDCRTVRFGSESAHEILREVDPVRNRALGEIDIFLASRLGR